MPLTKEQLLIPRYLCTGTPGKQIWPGSIWRSGDIIEESKLHGDLMYCDKDGPRYSDFPHLFKPLRWWEYRQPDDMPEYVKSQETGRVYKRHKTASYHGFGPATREEYEEHLNSKS